MTTATTPQAWAALKARVASDFTALPVLYQGDDNDAYDAPTPHAFVTMEVFNQAIRSFGGGRGATRWRNIGLLIAYVLVPKGYGLSAALAHAETFAAVFRSQNVSGVECYGATVDPSPLSRPGHTDPDGNYHVVAAVIDIRFDQIG